MSRSKLNHDQLRIRAQSIYDEVKRWRRIIKRNPDLKTLLKLYPEPVIKLLIDEEKACNRCGSTTYQQAIDEDQDGIHYCSECPDSEAGN